MAGSAVQRLDTLSNDWIRYPTIGRRIQSLDDGVVVESYAIQAHGRDAHATGLGHRGTGVSPVSGPAERMW